MSTINFCETKEQLNHLGEVVTGKTNGSPSGADIETSTLPYTGQVRNTLPALEELYLGEINEFIQESDQVITDKTAEFDTSIANKEAEADAAIDSYRLLNKGPYSSGITLESKFEYITYNGEAYFATNPPYTTTATTPDNDANLFVGGYVNESLATQIAETVLDENISTYTDIVYKASGGKSAVENMIAGVPTQANIGGICSTGGTIWKRVLTSTPTVISDFSPITPVDVFDYGAKPGAESSQEIQTAINAHENIVLNDYYWVDNGLTTPSGRVISGSGHIKSIKEDVNVFTLSSVSDVVISGLTIETFNERQSNGSVNNCLTAVNSSNFKFEGCKLIHNGGRAVRCIGSSDFSVNGNSANQVAFDVQNPTGDYESGAPETIYISDLCVNFSLTNNDITNCASGIAVQSVTKDDIVGAVISNNKIKRASTYGIFVYAVDGAQSKIDSISITSNTIQDVYGSHTTEWGKNFGAGIYCLNPYSVSITGNSIKNTCIQTDSESLTPAAIGFNQARGECSVTSNTITTSKYNGVRVSSGKGGGVTISSNSIQDCQRESIYTLDSDGTVISSNVINVTSNVRAIFVRGILSDILQTSITANQIMSTGFSAIETENAGYLNISNNIISAAAAGSVIKLDGGYSFNVMGNIINSGTDAVTIASAHNGLISSNVTTVSGRNIYIRGASTSVLARGNITPSSKVIDVSGTNNRVEVYADTPPSGSTWTVGCVLLSTSPSPSGFIGKVCTTSGPTGVAVFKDYGQISS